MATRGTISVEHSNGTVSQIYTHWDSYLPNNGKILLENYTTLGQVEALVANGDITSLGDSIDTTEFYGVNDIDDSEIPDTFPSKAGFYECGQEEEYNYFFTNNEWTVKCFCTANRFVSLSEAFDLAADYENE